MTTTNNGEAKLELVVTDKDENDELLAEVIVNWLTREGLITQITVKDVMADADLLALMVKERDAILKKRQQAQENENRRKAALERAEKDKALAKLRQAVVTEQRKRARGQGEDNGKPSQEDIGRRINAELLAALASELDGKLPELVFHGASEAGAVWGVLCSIAAAFHRDDNQKMVEEVSVFIALVERVMVEGFGFAGKDNIRGWVKTQPRMPATVFSDIRETVKRFPAFASFFGRQGAVADSGRQDNQSGACICPICNLPKDYLYGFRLEGDESDGQVEWGSVRYSESVDMAEATRSGISFACNGCRKQLKREMGQGKREAYLQARREADKQRRDRMKADESGRTGADREAKKNGGK